MQEEISQTCKNFRLALAGSGLSRAQLAALSDVTEASISRYLSGKSEPRTQELLRICRALGVSMEWMLTAGTDDGRAEMVAETPLLYGAREARRIDRVQRRIDEVIAELQEIKAEMQRHKN